MVEECSSNGRILYANISIDTPTLTCGYLSSTMDKYSTIKKNI